MERLDSPSIIGRSSCAIARSRTESAALAELAEIDAPAR
jgi:hypothetical protein